MQKTPVDGTLEWYQVQLDQTAVPIMLGWKLWQAGVLSDSEITTWYNNMLKPAAEFLANGGNVQLLDNNATIDPPWTQQERWEEQLGYSPSTTAAVITGLLAAADIRALRHPDTDSMLIEEYIPGREVALEGVVTNGHLQVFAIVAKPDPLEGPFFEETVYVIPDRLPAAQRRDVVGQVEAAALALGLTHGPVHAECRIGRRGAVVLEVAARPIGGLCSRVLRFDGPDGSRLSLEDVLLRHALGRPVTAYRVTREAAAVMMIPVPRGGICQRVEGLDAARSVPLIEDVVVTVKPGQRLVPWPEGASYPGFIFARGASSGAVVAAVRAAHDRLAFHVAPEIPVAAGPEAGGAR